ncbi:MAG: hypothetical protein ACI81P_001331 [Neolewinella sp.]|jgi:hypothetical protein
MVKISETVINSYYSSKVNESIDFSTLAPILEMLEKINSGSGGELGLMESDPSFEVYSLVQNVMSYFAEELSLWEEFSDFNDKAEIMQEEYLPSFPPMSPITNSYFTYWAYCDMQFGKQKETINTILADVGLAYLFDKTVMRALTNLNSSCMRFYKHLGFKNDMIVLKDILTGETYSCICISGHKGQEHEIWYARIVSTLDNTLNYYLVLTTPYVILNYTEKHWIEFFQRRGIHTKKKGFNEEYHALMKQHPDLKYWHDYIMDGYVNYTSGCIYLTGIPDIESSKPHSS